MRRRLTSSVNSTFRTSCDSSTWARITAQRALPILPLFPGRRPPWGLIQLFLELLHDRALLADRFDLLEDFLRALVHSLVGNLVILEDDELADGARAGLELISHRDESSWRPSACGRSI